MTRHTVFSSEGMNLQFDDDQSFEKYEKDIWKLKMKYYGVQRWKKGIWATNQDKFVKRVEDLNEWDSTFMEEQFKLFLQEEPQ